RTVLRLCANGALVSGLLWAALPVVGGVLLEGETTVMMFVLAGICGGAVIQGTTYARMPISFVTPVLGAAILVDLWQGGVDNLVSAGTAAFFLFVLAKGARQAEATFCEKSRVKHGATAMADALGRARDQSVLAAAKLHDLANRDTLTSLANRAAFTSDLRSCLDRARRDGTGMWLLLLDLDDFKLINDTLGHAAGDSVLVEIGARLRTTLHDDALPARLGGDDFAVMLAGDADPDAVAQRLIAAIGRPLPVGERNTKVGASIGIAHFPQDGATADDLMARADLALYEAKALGRQRFRRFDAALHAAADMRRDLELDLSAALAEGAVEVWYQPQIAIADRRLVGVEALIRWRHPRRGWIAPPDIVAAARATYQSETLTSHVASQACGLIRSFQDSGFRDVTVAINVSPSEIGTYALSDRIAAILSQHGVPAQCLEIEITEEATISEDAKAREFEALANLGVRIAIDDFGTGYASLAYLRTLRVDRIKIDRSFVTGLSERAGDRVLVQAILGIGRALEIQVVAEGVESLEDVRLLGHYGCPVAQGHHIARPMPRAQFDEWLAAFTAESNLGRIHALRAS
ncbi:MAG TPA: EAL domain-containing protein, partial [Methylobacterium sp.]